MENARVACFIVFQLLYSDYKFSKILMLEIQKEWSNNYIISLCASTASVWSKIENVPRDVRSE